MYNVRISVQSTIIIKVLYIGPLHVPLFQNYYLVFSQRQVNAREEISKKTMGNGGSLSLVGL